jgi:hypothetical protein
MKRLLKRPYIYWVIGIFISYISANLLISEYYKEFSLKNGFYCAASGHNGYIINIIFAVIIGALISLNAVLAFIKFRERQKCRSQVAATSIGAVAGVATGFCPVCVTGLVPLIFSFIGVSFSFASLPFNGLEIQTTVALILAISLYSLSKKSSKLKKL